MAWRDIDDHSRSGSMRVPRPLSQAPSTPIVLPAGDSVDAPVIKIIDQCMLFHSPVQHIMVCTVAAITPATPAETVPAQPEPTKDVPISGTTYFKNMPLLLIYSPDDLFGVSKHTLLNTSAQRDRVNTVRGAQNKYVNILTYLTPDSSHQTTPSHA